MKKFMLRRLLTLMLTSLSLTAHADDATDLAKKSQNPVENLISVPLDSNFYNGYGPNGNTQYILNLKPVIPIELTSDFNLITRTILPIAHQPNLFPKRNYINGIGDLNPSFFLTPAKPGKIIWGIGPTAIFPTATNKQIGQGKYSLGPSLVVLSMPGPWVLGFLMLNAWSIAGDSNRVNVNEFQFQYFINYNFSHGWYLTTQPIILADWTADAKNRWTVPVGMGGGKVLRIGKQPVNVSLQAYANVKTPSAIGPNSQFALNISLLYPE